MYFSRVRSRNGLKIFTTEEDNRDGKTTTNVVL